MILSKDLVYECKGNTWISINEEKVVKYEPVLLSYIVKTTAIITYLENIAERPVRIDFQTDIANRGCGSICDSFTNEINILNQDMKYIRRFLI